MFRRWRRGSVAIMRLPMLTHHSPCNGFTSRGWITWTKKGVSSSRKCSENRSSTLRMTVRSRRERRERMGFPPAGAYKAGAVCRRNRYGSGGACMRITETVRHYLVDLQVRGRTAVTVADYSRRLDDVVELLEKLCSISELEQVRVQHLRQCVQHMLTAKIEYVRGRKSDNGLLSPVTVRAYVRVIKAFFHWCYQEDLVSDDPSKRLVAPKVPTRVVPAFTEEHIE